jgi:uncharacterized membrane protein
MTTDTAKSESSTIFVLSMWWRIFYGVLRIFLTLVLLKFVGTEFSHFFVKLMSHEFTQDSPNFILKIVHYFINYSDLKITYYLAFYFLFWGVLDIFLSICLLKKKTWAYPVAAWAILLFIVYAIYRYFHTQSNILLAIIVLDICIIILIHLEYRKILLAKKL